MKAEEIIRGFQAVAPYIGAASLGGAIGGATSNDRSKGALKGSLIALGSLAGGRLAMKGGSIAANKVLGKEKLKNASKLVEDIAMAKKLYPNATLLSIRVISESIHKALVESGLAAEAAKFAQEAGDPANFATAYKNLSDSAKKVIKDVPLDYYKLLSKQSGIVQGAGTLGSGLGLSGTAYALRNGNNSKKR